MAFVGPKMIRSVPRMNHKDIEKSCNLISFQNVYEDTHWTNGRFETRFRNKVSSRIAKRVPR